MISGTGYTSLAHLTRLPLDKLKIDQSFIAPLPGDSGAAAITRAIIEMAHGLGLQVSAEGVRQPAQRELLAAWGCDELQGELIGEPMAVRRLRAVAAAAPHSDREPMSPMTDAPTPLQQLIARQIADAGGWLPFDRFMALALYARASAITAATARSSA